MIARRSFFKSLSLVGAAASVAPGLFIPRLEAVTWKRKRTRKVIRHNPAYQQAKFEFYFIGLPMGFDPEIVVKERSPDMMDGWHLNGLMYPVRGNEFTPDGKLISIPPFIEVTLEL